MATDARGHTIPTGSDFAARKSLTDLSLSIPSIYSAASQSAADLYRASLPTPPTVAAPCYVWRSDWGVLTIHDGSRWMEVGDRDVSSGIAGTNGWTITVSSARRQGRFVTLNAFLSHSANAFAAWETKPIGTVASALRPVAASAGSIALRQNFQIVIATDGTLSVQSSAATTWEAGNWGATLQWCITA